MLRAVPATIRIAASTSFVFRSTNFFSAISRTCSLVIEATLLRFGSPEPLAIRAALF